MKYCTNCGQNLRLNNAKYCTACGSPQGINNNSSVIIQAKSRRKVVLLSLIVGFLGFEGIGHLYIGKTHRGITLLLIGWGISISYALFSFMSLPMAEIIIGMSFLGFWIWQVYDANKLAKQHNETVIQNRGTY
jgi:TM2 domain-containing membrane protein YozV